MSKITVNLATNLKEKPKDQSKLGFGQYFTDHMFIMNYDEGQGWHDARIVPYGPLPLDPSAMCLHYGQEVFEGLKAYKTQDGRILMFRPDQNFKRLSMSNERMVIPAFDEEFMVEALIELVKIEKDWIPTAEGTSLYIRPFIIAVDPMLGVHPAHHYLFMIILSPVGSYYAGGLAPVNIYVESNYVRAVKGGLGFAKTAANYAASLKGQAEAELHKYSQVLWLDGIERKYIEEVGAMNIFFVIGDELVTPALNGSILPGITRMSVIEIAKQWGMKVSERRISIDEISAAYDKGELKEVFGSGTAAVISPVGHLKYNDKIMIINNGKIGAVSQKLYDNLTGIQWGKLPDTFGWTVEVK
ncbi:branched-chain amino acid aminotransferase [Acetanaerobacterium elongatum]|uniref:Branched-chain-amino-acid aminotransferase n=1 Tax=Acetanaerobacterium elongatum TaxID=258515 RepID=A0A1H0BTH4_9FIRM|nr:branched-chain amino acid aminotransferase [Acetanaerobacterium elongatum]SDN48873.1 branched-chain amino acid aminotransferase [Acetanaerobacterium elongatum]